jgi:hypothetical protein
MNRPANDDGPRDIGLYVINLDSSSMPMPLTVPFRHELVGFTVFRSRSFEYGRERFRLHLGYFESARSAEEALSVVRKHYPAAWISAAPESHLGSLDNTQYRISLAAHRLRARRNAREPHEGTCTRGREGRGARRGQGATPRRCKPGRGVGRSVATTLRRAARMVASASHCSGRSAACDLWGVPRVHGTHAVPRFSAARPATRFLHQR